MGLVVIVFLSELVIILLAFLIVYSDDIASIVSVEEGSTNRKSTLSEKVSDPPGPSCNRSQYEAFVNLIDCPSPKIAFLIQLIYLNQILKVQFWLLQILSLWTRL